MAKRRTFRSLIAATLCTGLIVVPVFVRPRPVAIAAADRCTRRQPAIAANDTLRVDGRSRSYLVRAPVRSGLLPAIFAFHGRGETPAQLEQYSGLSALRAVVVYPAGFPGRGGKLSWSGTPTAAPGVDDIRFVEMALDRLESTACVDRMRVYATGKSDGGGLAAHLACAAADRFAAVAPVAGAYYPIAGGCRPARAVAILEFHGTADRVVPYAGSQRRRLPAIDDWLGGWANRDGCARAQPSVEVADGVMRRRWTNCREGALVEAYRIDGGGHTWPGALAPSGPGATSDATRATTTMRTFFEAHTL